MKTYSQITICGALLMTLLGSTLGQQVQSDLDHQLDFSQYKTYSWQEIKSIDSLWDARIRNAVNGQLAAKGWTQVDNAAANTQPVSKGSTQAANGVELPFPPPPPLAEVKNSTQSNNGPDFPFPPPPPLAAAQTKPTTACNTSAPCVTIVAFVITRIRPQLQSLYSGFGGGGMWQGSGTISVQDYKEGTLVIDMYDAKTKQLLWRSSAEGTLSDKAAKNEKKLDKAVVKMFKDFPPSSTKR